MLGIQLMRDCLGVREIIHHFAIFSGLVHPVVVGDKEISKYLLLFFKSFTENAYSVNYIIRKGLK
jgi:hypothetical protein